MEREKVVVVTGGTDGIGKALVELYLKMGYKVATCGRSPEKLTALENSYPATDLMVVSLDVRDENGCKSFIEQIISRFQKIDVLINNAGISMHAMFSDVSTDTMKQVMDINFWGAVYCTKYALPHIVQQKGVIVGVTSIAGYRGLPGRSGYSASKFALVGWLEALRVEVMQQGVHVMWVAPGFTRSNVRRAALLGDGSRQEETPLDESRLMTAEECAIHVSNAISKRKRTLVLTFQGKETVFMNKHFPSITDRFIRKFFFKGDELIK